MPRDKKLFLVKFSSFKACSFLGQSRKLFWDGSTVVVSALIINRERNTVFRMLKYKSVQSKTIKF